MTDFDYWLANHAIRITSDRSECVCFWFWPQMTGIRDRMIAAAKQDMWEARREPHGQVFSGERRGNQCDLTIDQLRTWKGLVRVRFKCKETSAAVLAWAKENGIVLVDDREKFPARPHFTDKQRVTDTVANEVRSCDGKPPSRPHQ